MSIQNNWQQEMSNDYQEAHHCSQEAHYENVAERIIKRHEAMMKLYPHMRKSLELSQSTPTQELQELMQAQRISNIQQNKCEWKEELRKLYADERHFCWKEDRDVGISEVLVKEYMSYWEQCYITGLIMRDNRYSDPINEYISEEVEHALGLNMETRNKNNEDSILDLLRKNAVEYYKDKIQRQLDEWFDDEFGAPYSGEK